MTLLTNIGAILGGLGLFLLAVAMITDGLRLAASQALREVLSRWTSTPLRGIVSGALIASFVQSCSTVTVITIGFVNSGLLSLFNAFGVIYGANVGTTAMGWLIALVGFGYAPSEIAYPMVGVGILMRTFGRNEKIGAMGEAVAGLGLFLVALEILKTSFLAATPAVEVSGWLSEDVTGLSLSIAIGLAAAALLHSSGALALVLSAAIGGLTPLPNAIAMLIGVNIGGTAPALLTAFQGTPNAKRLASAYLAFNLVTGVAVTILFALSLWGLRVLPMADRLAAHPALVLAGFYTFFNLVGVALFWPATKRFAAFMERLFRTAEEDEAQPRFLDKAVIATPTIGVDALVRELGRMGEIACAAAQAALTGGRDVLSSVKGRRIAVRSLALAIGDFVKLLRRRNLPTAAGESLPTVLRGIQYYEEVAVLAERTLSLRITLEARPLQQVLSSIRALYAAAAHVVAAASPLSPDSRPEKSAAEMVEFLKLYQSVKEALLRAGADEDLAISDLSACLDQISRVRRMIEQTTKAARYLHGLTHRQPSAEPGSAVNAEAAGPPP
jgi:phosphate:Na+ symporter